MWPDAKQVFSHPHIDFLSHMRIRLLTVLRIQLLTVLGILVTANLKTIWLL